MEINVGKYSTNHDFIVNGVSYIGAPESNTAMFVTNKVSHLIALLKDVNECLVFAESGLRIDEVMQKKHCFIFSSNPQSEYAKFTEAFYNEEEQIIQNVGYEISSEGAYISKTAIIGMNSIIEPGAIIGPSVVIGDNAKIYSGAVIKNAIIGDNVIVNEKAVIGANGFTMANDEFGNKIRIYSLGKVRIGNNVEIGVNDNISRGSGGDTIIEDFVKIDALVHIGHDVHLHNNVEITAGAVIGGFVEAYEGAYVGINAVVRNRVKLGNNCFIGMGATVTKTVEANTTVVGNPAKPFIN